MEPFRIFDDYDPPSIDIAVTRPVLLEHAGAQLTPDGNVQYAPPPIQPPHGVLRFGRHHLGTWVIDAVTGGTLGHGRVTYTARLRRLEEPPEHEPLDDDVALWLKHKRDEYADESGNPIHPQQWGVLDGLLDEYREHRATGTPLDHDTEN